MNENDPPDVHMADTGDGQIESNTSTPWYVKRTETQHFAYDYLLETTQKSPEDIQQVVENYQCPECTCKLIHGMLEDCECPCHCTCCCGPFLLCQDGCNCVCDCHFESHSESDDTTTNEELTRKPSQDDKQTDPSHELERSHHQKQEGEAKGLLTTTQQSHPESMDIDETYEPQGNKKPTAATPPLDQQDVRKQNHPLSTQSPQMEDSASHLPSADDKHPQEEGELHLTEKTVYKQLSQHLHKQGQPLTIIDQQQIIHFYFNMHYKRAQRFKNKKQIETIKLNSIEQAELWILLRLLIVEKEKTEEQLNANMRDIVICHATSKWSMERVIKHRTQLAQNNIVRTQPANVWNTPHTKKAETHQPQQDDMELFRFDPNIYSPDTIAKYKGICMERHQFPETLRKPTEDEWNIVTGIMTGRILAKITPEFVKRCCTFDQLSWIQEQTTLKAEGELYITLPEKSPMYDFGQSTQRVVQHLRNCAERVQWEDPRFYDMLNHTKIVTYNHELHALHFHFYTKEEANKWEHMVIPFRKARRQLINPDSKYKDSTNPGHQYDGIAADGQRDDRYQSHYKFRLINVTHTMPIAKLGLFLDNLTGSGIKSGVPMDSYGPNSAWSLTWEYHAKTAVCPKGLMDVNRIIWNGHTILVIHKPGPLNAPCLNCARTGHQATNCPTPKADWNNRHTIIVTADQIANLQPKGGRWSTNQEALEIFNSLGGDQQESRPSEQITAPSTTLEHDTQSTVQIRDGTVTQQPQPANTEHKEWKLRKSRGKSKLLTSRQGQPTSTNSSEHQNPINIARSQGSRYDPISIDDNQIEPVAEEDDPMDGEGPTSPGSALPDNTQDDQHLTQKPSIQPKKSKQTIKRKQRLIEDDEATMLTYQKQNEVAKVATKIQELAGPGRRNINRQQMLEKIQQKIPNLQAPSSAAGAIEAIGGYLADTPANGNCQYYAVAESLMQRGIYEMEHQATLIEVTRLLKYGILLASLVHLDQEQQNSTLTAMWDYTDGITPDMTKEANKQRIKEYFQAIALSRSEIESSLPVTQWGGFDTLRMMAKAIQRRIFVIGEHSNPFEASFHVYTPQCIRSTQGYYPSAAMEQMQIQNWTQQIYNEWKDNHVDPIVLRYKANHYQAILFQAPTAAKPVPTKQVQLRLDELFKTKPVNTQDATDDHMETSTVQQSSAGSEQALSKLHDSLFQNTHPTTNPDATTTRVTDGDIGELTLGLNQRTEEQAADPSYNSELESQDVASPINSSLESQYSLSQANCEEAPTTLDRWKPHPQGYGLRPPNETSSWEEANGMWNNAREEWLEHYHMRIPELEDVQGLTELASTSPDILSALIRNCEQPLTVLEHFSTKQLKSWTESKRINHNTTTINRIIQGVTDVNVRNQLADWVHHIVKAPSIISQRAMYRNKDNWEALRTALPEHFKGQRPYPFLTKEPTHNHTLILVLEEVFPTLALDITQVLEHFPQDNSTMLTLPQVYGICIDLRRAVQTVRVANSWTGIAEFLNSIPHHQDASPSY